MGKSKKKFLENINQFYVMDKKADLVNIYFIVCIQHKSKNYLNRVKIGYAKDVKKRLAGLQIGNPVALKVWYSFPIEVHRARDLEMDLHRKFRHSRTIGEWFMIHNVIREWVSEHKKRIQSVKEKPAHILRKQDFRIKKEYRNQTWNFVLNNADLRS